MVYGLGFRIYARVKVLHQGGALLISRGDLQNTDLSKP